MAGEFNARMLILARDAEGLTQNALAHLAGISQGKISKIENGFEVPQSPVLDNLADACGVPIEFFFQHDEVLGEGVFDFFHKKRLTLPVKPLKKANALANVRRMEATRLLRTVEFDHMAPFPVLPSDGSWSPDSAAEFVRATWRIPAGPLPNLIALVEAAGLPVFTTNLGHEKLSAISMPGGSTGRHVIVVNGMLAPSAQRFSLAHELGHLVMHNGSATDDMERDADAFASALLMPAADIRRELSGLQLRDLGPLKNRWRVSFAALARRAHDLRAITDAQYRSLFIHLSKLPGGRKNEPGEFDAEEPRLIKYLISHYEGELKYSRSEVAKLMVLKDEKLASVYFGDQVSALRSIKRVRHLHSVPTMPIEQM